MFKSFAFVLVLFLLFDSSSISDNDPVSLQIDLSLVHDGNGLLDRYKAHVVTPVCEQNSCYAIEIEFYWDIIGRFAKYDTLPGKRLTKLDHIPFNQSDYDKMLGILRDPNALLAAYSKEQLTGNTRSSEIDGVTGATVNEIRGAVVEGAVYSCYTLWHIAHGSIVDSIQYITKRHFTKELVKKLIEQDDQDVNYFLIDNFSESEFSFYLPEILQIILDGKGYLPKNAIEKIPVKVLAKMECQEFFAINFNRLNYFSQLALLKKLENETLSTSLRSSLTESLDTRASYRNDLIKKLTGK